MTAIDLTLRPEEHMALTIARAQISRGEPPTPNIAIVCVVALARLVGAPIHEQETRP